MIKIFVFMVSFLLCLHTQVSFAQEAAVKSEMAQVDSAPIEGIENTTQPLFIEKNPQVGKHVMANMNASSMILSLIMVLAVIFISAIVLKRFNITQQLDDKYVFKVPSLRNVALTAPYLHDGSQATLEDVISTMMFHQLGIPSSEEDIRLIVKFLNTLTGEYQGKPLQ